MLIMATVLINCGNSKSKNSALLEVVRKTDDSPPPPPPPPMVEEMKEVTQDVGGRKFNEKQTNVEIERKLIRKGNLTIKDKNIEKTVLLIKKLLKSLDGFLTKESKSRASNANTCHLSININSKNFDRFIFSLDSAKLVITEKELSSEDITARYIDNQTRLNNKKLLEQRYLEILKTAKTVSEIMEIEARVQDVRADIESKEEIKKLFDHQVSYSEIEIQIADENNSGSISNKGFWSSIVDKLEDGWDGAKSFVLFLIAIWPMYLVGLLAYQLVRIVIKRRRSKLK